jgi:hypothetical protein
MFWGPIKYRIILVGLQIFESKLRASLKYSETFARKRGNLKLDLKGFNYTSILSKLKLLNKAPFTPSDK